MWDRQSIKIILVLFNFQINPQRTIPVIIDEDGFVVADSHAINAYLASKYSSDDQLYPKCLKLRSIVDSKMYFDAGVLFQLSRNIAISFFYEKSITGLTKDHIQRFEQLYGILEECLQRSKFITGDNVTIADYSVLTTLSNMVIYVPVDSKKFNKLATYINNGNEAIPYLKALNDAGAAEFRRNYELLNFKF